MCIRLHADDETKQTIDDVVQNCPTNIFCDNNKVRVCDSKIEPTDAPIITPTTEAATDPLTEATTAPTTQPTTVPTTQPTTVPTTQPTTVSPIFPFVCTASGKFQHLTDCHSFYVCNANLSGYPAECPIGLYFNPTTTNCVSDVSVCTPASFKCTAAGKFAHPTDEDKYILCVTAVRGGFTKSIINCPSGRIFSVKVNTCIK